MKTIPKGSYRFVSGAGFNKFTINGGIMPSRTNQNELRGEDFCYLLEAAERLGEYIGASTQTHTIANTELYTGRSAFINAGVRLLAVVRASTGARYCEAPSITGDGLHLWDGSTVPATITFTSPTFTRELLKAPILALFNNLAKFDRVWLGIDWAAHTSISTSSAAGQLYRYTCQQNSEGEWVTSEAYANGMTYIPRATSIACEDAYIALAATDSTSTTTQFLYICRATKVGGNVRFAASLSELTALVPQMLSLAGITKKTSSAQIITVGGKYSDDGIPAYFLGSQNVI